MDFSQQQFFANQPYQNGFMGIPPLTPSNSNPADDYGTTSPPEVFDNFPADHFQGFDGNTYGHSGHFNSNQPGYVGPPTPPNHPAGGQVQQHQQQQQHQQHQQGLNGIKQSHVAADVGQMAKVEPMDDAAMNRPGSEEDESNLTPQQSRRKAQNRAAQRAFRERKERHVKDLEAKLATLEANNQHTTSENERLKRDLQKMSTENEILRATSSMGPSGSMSPEPTTTGPMHYSPTDFYSDLLANHANKAPSHRIVTSDDGERLLAAGATWDYIISHESFKRGLVDVGDVSDRLKHLAKCDGQGPVFSEREIRMAIEQSVASGSDELL